MRNILDEAIERYTSFPVVCTPGVVSGRPRLHGRRIRVQDVTIWILTMSVSEIAFEYNLTIDDVHILLAYYYRHKESIDEDILSDRLFVDSLNKGKRQ